MIMLKEPFASGKFLFYLPTHPSVKTVIFEGQRWGKTTISIVWVSKEHLAEEGLAMMGKSKLC
jgi:hypothetical protein